MGPEHPDSCEVTIRPLLDRQRERIGTIVLGVSQSVLCLP